MSAEIINLRKARKAKQRREAEARAEENRAKFGRAKAEREANLAEKEREARRLDLLRRQGGDEEPSK
jgi:hypothetical protein